MKRYILTTLCTVIIMSGIAQNTIVRYEYWFDKEYANKHTSSVQPNTSDFSFSALANNLKEGIHNIYFRFQDNNGKWSSVTSSAFLKVPLADDTGKEICKYEYWFDQNYNAKVLSPITPTEIVLLDKIIDITTLTSGLHTLNIRFANKAGEWSVVSSDYFTKQITTDNQAVLSIIKLYPNPFTDKLSVSGLSENGTIRVLDLNGRVVLNQQMNSGETVNTSALPSGSYIIKLSLKTGELEWKATKR